MPAKSTNKKTVVGRKSSLSSTVRQSSVGVKFLLASLSIIVVTGILTVAYLQWQDAQRAEDLKAKASSAQTSYNLLGKQQGVAAWICRAVSNGNFSENEVIFVNDNWKEVTPFTILRSSGADPATQVTISTNSSQREWYNYVSAMKSFTSTPEAEITVAIATDQNNIPGTTVQIGTIKQRDVNSCPAR